MDSKELAIPPKSDLVDSVVGTDSFVRDLMTEFLPTPEDRLSRIGISPELLMGQEVLVMHEGDPIISEADAERFNAKAINTYDPGEFDSEDDALPYRAERFDYIIADNGILHDGKGDSVSTDMLCEVIRILKKGGQIRIYDAFSGVTYKNLDVLPDNISWWMQDKTDHRVDVSNVVPEGQDRPYLQIKKKLGPEPMTAELQA